LRVPHWCFWVPHLGSSDLRQRTLPGCRRIWLLRRTKRIGFAAEPKKCRESASEMKDINIGFQVIEAELLGLEEELFEIGQRNSKIQEKMDRWD
jgi:hypothetical protein